MHLMPGSCLFPHWPDQSHSSMDPSWASTLKWTVAELPSLSAIKTAASNAGVQVHSLVGEVRSHILHGQKTKTLKKKKQEQYSIKTLRMAHIKKIKLKKTWMGKKRSQREAAGWRGSGNPWHGTRGACRLSVLTPPRAVRGPGLVPLQSGKACCPPGGVRLEWRYH